MRRTASPSIGRAMLRRSAIFAVGVTIFCSALSGTARTAPARVVDSEDDSDDTKDAPTSAKASPNHTDKPSYKVSAKDAPPETEADESDDAKGGTQVETHEAPIAVTPDVAHPFSTVINGWTATLYGFAELDLMRDSTQSYVEGSLNTTLARPNTLPGDNPRLQETARNSRIGFIAAAPEVNGIKASGVVEVDFFGNTLPTGTQNAAYTEGAVRMRQFYLKLESSILDLLAGQTHDLYGWGGAGFYPNTPAFLPVLGEIYHRNPQIRLSKVFASRAVDIELAVAAVRPLDRDSGLPDGEAGLRLAINGWKGARTSGAGRPVVAPLGLGVSVIGRRLSVNDFSATPGNPQVANAGGLAVDVFLPIIPARGRDMSNAVSISGEFSTGSGIADLSPNLTGGVGFPQLPNPNNDLSVPTYTPNIDPGIATFDSDHLLQTIQWTTILANIQYHLPIADGTAAWISATYSHLGSKNAMSLTPQAGKPYAWDLGQYIDGTLWLGLTSSAQVALSVQSTQQTFGDGVKGTNVRGEGSFYFFF
jgi:hypothetical protein